MKKFLILAVFLALGPHSGAQETYTIKTDPVLNAMEGEIKRSMPKLKRAQPPLYFLSYTITDSEVYNLSSVLGAQAGATRRRSRVLDVEARSGSRSMDNTRKLKELAYHYGQRPTASTSVPVEDDAPALARALWLVTEQTLKQAQENYRKVQTNAQTAAKRGDDSPDFSQPIKAHTYYASAAFPQVDEAALQTQLNAYSALFKGYDFIFGSRVGIHVEVKNVYYVNSEGAKLKTPGVLMRLSYSLLSRNADGMELERGESYDFTDIAQMPAPEAVQADIARSIAELKTLRAAPVADTYHGPVILRGKAAGVFFHEILGHRLEGHRQKDDDFGQTFTQKMNQQIVSPIITVEDNPTLSHYNGIPLRGHYLYDDEGVKAQNVKLIENGVLKAFLMGRSPVKGFAQSNGHGRKAPGYDAVSRMGNTIITASQTMPYAQLRQKLLEEAQKQGHAYGLVIEDISGGFTNTDTWGPQSFKVQPLLVYKVYADGRPDEVIRGADIVGTPLASFNKISAAGDDYDVFNGSCGAESGWVPVSAVAPSLLISEMEIEKSAKTYDSPPLLPPPGAQEAKKGGK